MTVLLGAAPSIIGPSDVGAWMAAKGAPGAAALLDFATQKYGFRSAAGVPRWGSLAGDLTFSRASAAGRWPAAGPFEMVGSGEPAFDHDPATREAIGLRLEGASSPITPGTTSFATAASWGSSFFPENVVPVASAFAPGEAAKHITHGTGSYGRYQTRTVTAGANYRMDVILEKAGNPSAGSAFGLLSGSWLGLIFYNWLTNTLGAIGEATSLIVEQLGTGPNGGQMVRVSAVINVGENTSVAVYVYPTGSSGASAGQECILHYAALTPATGAYAPYGSPVIVPVGGAQVRAADFLASPLFCTPSEAFTISVRLRMPLHQNWTDSNTLFAIVPPSGIADRFSVSSYGPNGLVVGATYANALVFSTAILTETLPDNYVTVSWSPEKKYRATCLGAPVTKIAAATPPPGTLSRITWGSRAGGGIWGGTIKRAAVWAHDDFSDDQLRELSAA